MLKVPYKLCMKAALNKKKYRCIACSILHKPVFVHVKRDSYGFLTCPKCGGIELEQV